MRGITKSLLFKPSTKAAGAQHACRRSIEQRVEIWHQGLASSNTSDFFFRFADNFSWPAERSNKIWCMIGCLRFGGGGCVAAIEIDWAGLGGLFPQYSGFGVFCFYFPCHT